MPSNNYRTDISNEVLAERVQNLIGTVDDLESRVQAQAQELSAIKDDVSKARGGFVVLVAIGSLIAFAAGLIDRIAKWFH